MVNLRKALDAIDGKCTVYMVEKCSILSGYDYIANQCTHLDFCNGRRIYSILLIFIAQYVLAVMSHKSTITYINGFHREH